MKTADRPADAHSPVAVEPLYPAPAAWIHPDETRSWMRRLLPILMARRTSFFGALGLAVLSALVSMATPLVVATAIDRGIAERAVPLRVFVIALIVLAVLRAGMNYAWRYNLFRAGYGIEYDMRAIIYEHLSRLSFSFYDGVQSGQLISRANSDIRSVQMFLIFGPMMIIMMSTFLVAFVVMFTRSWTLTLVALLPLPGVAYVGIKMRKLIFPISWIVQARLADVATIVDENVTGVRIVKSFAAEALQISALRQASKRVRWAAVKQVDVRARYGPWLENLPRLALMLVLAYGGVQVINGTLTVGSIVLFSSYVLMLIGPFRMLGFLMMMSQRARASAERIFEILDTPPDITDKPGAVDLMPTEGAVEFRDVTFAYADGPKVLDGFSLRLDPGETVALVGRTGCGKSTVARLLMRFYDVDSGAVVVDGQDVRDVTMASLRARIGMVADDAFLFSDTIRDNIAYGRPDADLTDVVAAAKASGAHDFITDLPEGYDAIVGERGYDLSGGQRQRVSIARLLVTDPSILILDDATSSVDVKIEEEIHAALERVMERRTTLVIAHRLSTINLADRVVLMEGGKILAQGTHGDLMRTEPRYSQVLARYEEEEAAKQAAQPEEPAPAPRRPAMPRPDIGPDLDPTRGMN